MLIHQQHQLRNHVNLVCQSKESINNKMICGRIAHFNFGRFFCRYTRCILQRYQHPTANADIWFNIIRRCFLPSTKTKLLFLLTVPTPYPRLCFSTF
ncbi:hypothetical protein CW304_05100 [Bacillus sp. UFRGS-B20]|nr:hypothetical protein CW304_05100 [Bacillus sp. UFRGS-B20]